MPIPSRPVSGETIASDWGQHVHDYTFAPAGVRAHSSGIRAMSLDANEYRKLHLDVADDDPGGYLDVANDQVEIPADGGGLYAGIVQCRTDNGEDTGETDVRVRVNGSDVAKGQVGQEDATAVVFSIPLGVDLSAGDIITVFARQIGSGSRADVDVMTFLIYRIGAELGAPT